METLKEDAARWNSGAVIVFLAALMAALYLLNGRGALGAAYSLGFLDLLIISIATFRTAHLLSFDKIFDFVRAAFMDMKDGREVKPPRGFRRMVCELLECLWCTGLWAALLVLSLYLLGPVPRFIVIMLAVAGAGALLQLLSKALAKD